MCTLVYKKQYHNKYFEINIMNYYPSVKQTCEFTVDKLKQFRIIKKIYCT